MSIAILSQIYITDNTYITDIYVGRCYRQQPGSNQTAWFRACTWCTYQHTRIRFPARGPSLLVDCRGRVARCCNFAHLLGDVEPVHGLVQPNAQWLLQGPVAALDPVEQVLVGDPIRNSF